MHSFQNFHSSTVLVPRQIRTESDKVLIQKNRRLEVWRFKILLRCACTALDHQCLVLATFKISEIQTYTNWLLYAFENTHTHWGVIFMQLLSLVNKYNNARCCWKCLQSANMPRRGQWLWPTHTHTTVATPATLLPAAVHAWTSIRYYVAVV